MADENQQQEEGSGQEQGSSGGGTSTAVKAAAAAAATSVAALVAKKAFSGRSDSNGHSSNGSASRGGDAGSMLSSALSGGWEAARDALVPAAEDAAGAAGEYLANNGPDFVRDRIVPRFIDSFNEARGES
jgi:hypothetical protein